jgi:gas vesicle protein
MKKVKLEDITRDIASYIEKKVGNITYNDQKWKEHYDSVTEELKSEIERTKEAIKEYAEDNLTVNRIEMEGYLRGLITMTNQFERWLP